jgi:hypothetical protein
MIFNTKYNLNDVVLYHPVCVACCGSQEVAIRGKPYPCKYCVDGFDITTFEKGKITCVSTGAEYYAHNDSVKAKIIYRIAGKDSMIIDENQIVGIA